MAWHFMTEISCSVLTHAYVIIVDGNYNDIFTDIVF